MSTSERELMRAGENLCPGVVKMVFDRAPSKGKIPRAKAQRKILVAAAGLEPATYGS